MCRFRFLCTGLSFGHRCWRCRLTKNFPLTPIRHSMISLRNSLEFLLGWLQTGVFSSNSSRGRFGRCTLCCSFSHLPLWLGNLNCFGWVLRFGFIFCFLSLGFSPSGTLVVLFGFQLLTTSNVVGLRNLWELRGLLNRTEKSTLSSFVISTINTYNII